MVPEMRIPGHITALYVFAVVNLMALFHVTLVDANIVVVDQYNMTQYIIDRDNPASFGPPLTERGVAGHVYYVNTDGCKPLPRPPDIDPSKGRWIAIIRRHGCDFDVKVLNAQNALFVAALIHNVGSDDLVPMGSGKYGNEVNIPSAFIGQYDAYYLKEKYNKLINYTIIIDNRVPFNANLYLLPFAVVVGICFVLMVVFMIAKWIRDVRKRRRSRLSKEHLKKIPVKKFKKGDPYDVCAICLDEYEEGDKLRVLPCAHAYHMKCIDPWLTKNKRTCPVCKRKVIPRDPDNSDSDSDSDDEGAEGAGENTPLLGGASGRNNNTFNNSGLPDSMRSNVRTVHTGSSVDSGSDGEGGIQSSGTFHNSLAEVHEPSMPISRSPGGSYGSYGATATLKLTNEMPKVGSINSAYDKDSPSGGATSRPVDDEELYGAVGGVPADFLGDDDHVVVVNPKRHLVQPDSNEDDEDVRFVDNYYQEELRGVLGGEGSSTSTSGDSSTKHKGKKEKEKKKKDKTALPKKVSKKKKRRRDEVA